MSKRKPPRRTKHDYLVTFISHVGSNNATSHRTISMSAPFGAKDVGPIVNKLAEWNPGYTDIVITNVFYLGKS